MTAPTEQPSAPRLVILTPVHNEAENLPRYEAEVRATLLDRSDLQGQVLFIDDGSTDSSWDLIRDICRRDPRFTAIRLSRNYGSHIALSAGFEHDRGDCVCTLSCDLQDPPEVILEFLARWREGARIVWGKRRTREDARWRVAFSNLFFELIRRHAMPRRSRFTTGSFFLVDRKVADCFRQFREHNRITFALVAWTGFDQAVVEYDRKKRVAGVSKWTFAKMIKAMYDTFIGFSTLPIRLITWMGLGLFVLAFLGLLWLVISKLAGNPLPGWTSIMVTVLFGFGLQFLILGVMGEYLHRIYSEAVRRPLFFISDQILPPPGAGP
jgi:glycosyltransferase involved in cell wall biosynthesis